MRSVLRWCVLFGLTLTVVGLLVVREAAGWIAMGRAIAVSVEIEEGHLVLDYVAPDGPAYRAGLQVGDRLLTVDGRPVDGLVAYDEAASYFERGREASFRVLRDGAELVIDIEPGVDFPWARRALNALSCLAFLVLALLGLGQEPSEPRGRLLGIFSAAVALELAMPLNLIGFPGADQVVFPLYSILIGIQIGFELHLAASIPHYQPWRASARWAVPTFYVVGLGLGLFHAVSQLALYAGWETLPWSIELADLLFWKVGMAVWAIVLIFLLARTALSWPEPLGRQQAGLVLVGALPWAVLVFAGILHEAVWGGWGGWLDSLEALVLLVYPIAIFVAIFRYHLFDLELVVKRGMVWATLAGALVLMFYGVIAVTGTILSTWVSPSRWTLAAVGLASLLMGLTFLPLRQALQRLIERRVFPERRALRARLIRLASQLPAAGSLSSMGKELVDQLCEIFQVDWAAVLLSEGRSGVLVMLEATGLEPGYSDFLLLSVDDPGVAMLIEAERPLEAEKVEAYSEPLRQRLDLFGVELLVPLIHKEQLVGLLLLGNKRFGESYAAEEKELLNLLSHLVASAFENAHLFESATHDSLTGLLRREAVLERLERELRRAERFDRPLTVGMADLDHFKEVNDRYGHVTGDVALKHVAKALSAGLRESDMVGRYGGEEFLIVLTETDLDGAIRVAEKLRDAVQEIELPVGRGEAAGVTLSIGLADRSQLQEVADRSAITLIDLADRALYSAKGGGRNRVGVYRNGAPEL